MNPATTLPAPTYHMINLPPTAMLEVSVDNPESEGELKNTRDEDMIVSDTDKVR